MAIKLVLDGEPAEEPRSEAESAAPDEAELLSPEEKAQTEQFAATIDLGSSELAVRYGTSIQRQSADIASKTLDGVRSCDTGEISELLIRLVSAIDGIEGGSGRSGALADFFRGRAASETTDILANYDNAEAALSQIEKQLVRHQLVLQKDIVLLDALYEENLETYKALTMYIRAGELALERAKTTQLEPMQSQAQLSGRPEDEMRAEIFSKSCDQFEYRLDDLRLTRAICLQSAPQIRMIRENDSAMLIKLQSSIVNTLPVWRQKIAMSVTMKNSENAGKASRAMDSLTNRMLRDHASLFRKSVTASAKDAQRTTIDPETIEFVNREIAGAVKDYIAIEKKGITDRRSAEDILERSERRLSGSDT